MIEKVRTSWRSYREKRREYQTARALYKMNGGPTGAFSTMEHNEANAFATGAELPRVETPKGKAPDSGAE